MNSLNQLMQQANTSKLEQEIALAEKIEKLSETADREIKNLVERTETHLEAITASFKKDLKNLSNIVEKRNSEHLASFQGVAELSESLQKNVSATYNEITPKITELNTQASEIFQVATELNGLSTTAHQIKADLSEVNTVSQSAMEALKTTSERWKFLSIVSLAALVCTAVFQVMNHQSEKEAQESAVKEIEQSISADSQALQVANRQANQQISLLQKQINQERTRYEGEQERYNQLLASSKALEAKIFQINTFNAVAHRLSVCTSEGRLSLCITDEKGKAVPLMSLVGKSEIYQEIVK